MIFVVIAFFYDSIAILTKLLFLFLVESIFVFITAVSLDPAFFGEVPIEMEFR